MPGDWPVFVVKNSASSESQTRETLCHRIAGQREVKENTQSTCYLSSRPSLLAPSWPWRLTLDLQIAQTTQLMGFGKSYMVPGPPCWFHFVLWWGKTNLKRCGQVIPAEPGAPAVLLFAAPFLKKELCGGSTQCSAITYMGKKNWLILL